MEQGFREDLHNVEDSEQYIDPDWDMVTPGTKLMVKDLNQPVVVLNPPDKSGSLYIQMGMIKTKIHKDKLAVYDANLTKKVNLPLGSMKNGTSFSLKRYNISNKLDLRGQRVEEALAELDSYLDQASLANLSPVYIIHGHGTGALKSAVRSFISTSPYVAKYRIGEDAEGGDGVSVVDIK